MEDKAERVARLVRMFAIFNQEASEERMRGYLEILAPIPSRSLDEAITTAMASAETGYPPGPGQIVVAWKENRGARPEERPYRGAEVRQGSAAIDTGAVMTAIEARIEPGDEKQILAVARELRSTHARHFPAHPNEARTPSLVAAAMKLGMHWPMQADHVAQVSAWMEEAEKAGQKAGWWRSKKREHTTEWRGTYHA